MVISAFVSLGNFPYRLIALQCVIMCVSVIGYSKSPGQDLQFEWWSLADTNERNWCFHSSSNLKQKKKIFPTMKSPLLKLLSPLKVPSIKPCNFTVHAAADLLTKPKLSCLSWLLVAKKKKRKLDSSKCFFCLGRLEQKCSRSPKRSFYMGCISQ